MKKCHCGWPCKIQRCGIFLKAGWVRKLCGSLYLGWILRDGWGSFFFSSYSLQMCFIWLCIIYIVWMRCQHLKIIWFLLNSHMLIFSRNTEGGQYVACIPAPQESAEQELLSPEKMPPCPPLLVRFTFLYPKAFEFETPVIASCGLFPIGSSFSFLLLL